MRLVPLTRMLSSPGTTGTTDRNHFPGPAGARLEKAAAHSAEAQAYRTGKSK
jgi:hypothetical protein